MCLEMLSFGSRVAGLNCHLASRGQENWLCLPSNQWVSFYAPVMIVAGIKICPCLSIRPFVTLYGIEFV